MQKVVTAKGMQQYDRAAIERFAVPSLLLMENAGRSVVEIMEEEFGNLSGKRVYVFCGKGNNGGDGFVVARHLYNRGAHVSVFLAAKKNVLKGDAKVNCDVVVKIAQAQKKSASLTFTEVLNSRKLKALSSPSFVVDALFGTGFSGEVKGFSEEIVEWINSCGSHVASVDIPSGVNADNGQVANVAVKAEVTVTMGLRKIGLLVHGGRIHSGKVFVADISIPQKVYHDFQCKTYLVERSDVRSMLPSRPLTAHKHSVGKIFVLAGSKGLTGAAVMCSNAAMRSGAGAVVLGIPKSLLPIVSKKVTEVMPTPLEETEQLTVSQKAMPAIQRYVDWADIILLGPGLGRDEETGSVVFGLIEKIKKPMIIDADGLNALATNMNALKKRRGETILTPHTGELSRMIGISSKEIEENRVEIARQTARDFKVNLVFKGAPTLVAVPSSEVYINSTGNPGMATAGSGDVLSGTIVGLWGQHVKAKDAAISGVYVHGLAGDLAKEQYGEMGMVATDILSALPEAIKRIHQTESVS